MVMENHSNSSSINILPVELLRQIALRLPIKSVLMLRCVSKSWLNLISDPSFAQSHFELAAAPTHRCLFICNDFVGSYDLDALFREGHNEVKVFAPLKTLSRVDILGSCRGFILLDQYPYLILWNPVTGAHKRVSYSHVDFNVNALSHFFNPAVRVCGFGYDASKDDYLVVLGWRDKNEEVHFDFFSLRTNSWKNIEGDLPDPLMVKWSTGLFLNGAIHWLPCYRCRDDPILIFDTTERSFSKILMPEGEGEMLGPCGLVALGGCLCVYCWNGDVWVMNEYKVQSSWTLYKVFDQFFEPMGLSNGGHIIGFDEVLEGFSKCNFNGEILNHFTSLPFMHAGYVTYTESLLSLPNDSFTSKEEGRLVRNNQNEVKEKKRIKSVPT